MTSAPQIRSMRVIPVAGHDSLLLNLSGGHYPVFGRNLVVLEDSAGHTGVGETPGGERIRRTLEDCVPMVEGQSIARSASTLSAIRQRFGDLDAGGRGQQTFDGRIMIHALAAVESAFLDLLGQFLEVPVAELLGSGMQRTEVDVLGYLFYVGDTGKTDLDYREPPEPQSEWERLRHRQALDEAELIRLAGACIDAFGFDTLKLKGGVLEGQRECEHIAALKQAFPGVDMTLDPNAAWSAEDAIAWMKPVAGALKYAEDPCGESGDLSAVDAMALFRRETGIPTASNMIATDFPGLLEAVSKNALDIPLADCHFWTLTGASTVAALCEEWGLTWGSHSNNHLDVSLAMMTHVAAAAPGQPTPIDTHWIWQTGQRLTREPFEIRGGKLAVPDRPGLGIELDMERVDEAHRLYHDRCLEGRNDAIAMQALIPGWTFDPKRPCLVR